MRSIRPALTRTLVATLALSLFSPRLFPAQSSDVRPGEQRTPVNGAEQTPNQHLRDLYFREDSALMRRDGEAIAMAKGASLESRAWFAAAAPGYGPEVFTWLGALEDMHKEAEDNPWTLALDARFSSSVGEAIALCEQALGKDSRDDILWLCSDGISEKVRTKADTALLESFLNRRAAAFETSAQGLATRANALRLINYSISHQPYDDQAANLYQRALQLDPSNIRALIGRFQDLEARKEYKQATELFEHVPLPIESESLHLLYWRAITELDSLSKADQGKRIEADARKLLERGEPSSELVATLAATLSQNSSVRTALLTRVMQQYPHSLASEMATVMNAVEKFDPDGDLEHASKETKQALAGELMEFLNTPDRRGVDAEQRALDSMAELSHRMDLSDEQLFACVKDAHLAAAIPWMGAPVPQLLNTLANHKAHLPELEKLARNRVESEVQQAQDISRAWHYYSRFRDINLQMFWGSLAEWEDVLGWIYLQEGRVDDAEAKLLTAEALLQTESETEPGRKFVDSFPLVLLHLGRLYTAKGDYDKATEYLGRSLSAEYFDEEEHPAIAAYKDLYLAQHGSNEGIDKFMEAAYSKERERRKMHILQEKIAQPKPMQPFKLRTVDGKTVNSSDLKGKVVVINFWGTWCGPCKFELPAIQSFHDKYKNDPSVIFLTIDHSDELTTLKQFMAAKKYTFPVLIEERYVDDSGVMSFPTTWFVDREGKIAFEKVGSSRRIVDEFTWRIEELMKPAAAADASKAAVSN